MSEQRTTKNTAPIERVDEATYRQLTHREKKHYDPTQPHKRQREREQGQRMIQAQRIAKALLEQS